MSEDTHARGAILIHPPLTAEDTAALPASWLDRDQRPYRDVVLRTTATETPTADGVLTKRTADAIVPVELIGHHLLEHVQELVDHLPGRTFTGHLDCTWAREDTFRIVVRDGKAIEIRPTWPDDNPTWDPITVSGYQVWQDPDGELRFITPGETPPAGSRRVHVNTNT